MYKVSKQFSFSASHRLRLLEGKHPCTRMHGHNYLLILHLRSKNLDKWGFVKDYRELNEIKQYITTVLDHRNLNDIFSFNPTSENIAKFIYEKFKPIVPQLYAVEIKTTEKTSCIYEPECVEND